MKPHRFAPVLSLALAAASVLALGCSKKVTLPPVLNHRPEVRLTNAPIDTTGRQSYFYAYRLNWVGYDPDGRVDHYLYSIDPPSVGDTTWITTAKNEQIVFFHAGSPDSVTKGGRTASEFHVFVIKAVDDQGALSAPTYRAFFSYTIAPLVAILTPPPSALTQALVTPAVRITWTGRDPDGQFTQKPIKYKYILLKEGNPKFPIDIAISNPDSLRKFYAPNFEGWDSTSADTTFKQFVNLVPNSKYLFVVIGIDEAGAYSPVFSLTQNMVILQVGFAGTNGPILSMFNEFFFYTYASGGFVTDQRAYVNLEVPALQPITFNWFATPPQGSEMKQYRWVMDLANLDDETPRSNERTDITHWSAWGPFTQSATIGPFPGTPGENHLFFIEAEDINGLVSLGIINFTVVLPSLEHELLIVDDTRRPVDLLVLDNPDSVQAPNGGWPNAAELDTFLYARGNVHWRSYPPGSISPPGVFSGYTFDTLGTRRGLAIPTVSLQNLGQYRHVIWMVDDLGAITQDAPTNPVSPTTTLRWMTQRGRSNTLAAYVKLGGHVWMLGGASGYASMVNFDNFTNNTGGQTVFASTGTRPDLTPGRMMFDQVHWQSEFAVNSGVFQAQKFVASTINGVPFGGAVSRGDSAYLPDLAPNYSLLPTILKLRDYGTDPLPPLRNDNAFYNIGFGAALEYLTDLNYIQEDADPNPEVENFQPTLDTLFVAAGSAPTLGRFPKACMTYYHGNDNGPIVFSGFSIWDFRRQQCIDLVDFVLQQIWHLPRVNVSRDLPQPSLGPSAARRPRE